MLDNLSEYSMKIWDPVGEVFYSLFDSSSLWFPVVTFFIVIFLFLYFLRKFLDMIVELPLLQSLQIVFKFLLKASIVLLIVGVIASLGYYMYSKYNEQQKHEVVEKEQDFGYLLR